MTLRGPSHSERRPGGPKGGRRSRGLWLNVGLLALTAFGCVALLRGLAAYLFPTNIAFERGQNPAVITQLGDSIDPGIRMLHVTLMPYTGFHARPNLEERYSMKGMSFHHKTNNLGFLSRYDLDPYSGVPFKKAPNERVLLLTGASTAWGQGASANEKTISYVLEDLLNAGDPEHRWKVVNLANLGWIAYQEFIALDLYGAELDPEWIVTLDGRNDIMVPTTHGERVPNHYYFVGQKRLNDLFEELSDSERKAPAFLRYRNLAERIDRIAAPPSPIPTTEEMERAVRFYLHSVDSMIRRFGEVNFLLIAQPTTLLGSRERKSGNLVSQGYDRFIPRLEELARTNPRIRFLNGMNLYPDPLSKYLLPNDDCHLTDEGQAIMARAIAQVVLGKAP